MVGSSSRVIERVDRMKLSILISMIFLVLPGPIYGQRQPASRFGALELKEDEASNSHRLYRLYLMAKKYFSSKGTEGSCYLGKMIIRSTYLFRLLFI